MLGKKKKHVFTTESPRGGERPSQDRKRGKKGSTARDQHKKEGEGIGKKTKDLPLRR